MTSPLRTALLALCCTVSACHAQGGEQGTATPADAGLVGKGKTSIGQVLAENGQLPINERIALYHRLKKEHYEDHTFQQETDITMYGYSLLWGGKPSEALAVFQLLASEFPGSSNAYDCIGEAYLVLGDTVLAVANYEKALELDPNNISSLGQLDRIHGRPSVTENHADRYAKVFTVQQYRADLDELGSKLMELHPNALKFIAEKDLRELIERKKALLTDSTTYAQFNWHCCEIVASVKCSHTSTGGFFWEDQLVPVAKRFPLRTHFVDGRLYITDSLVQDSRFAVGDEIQRINGVPVKELVQEIYRHIPAQGNIETSKRYHLNTWSTAMIPFALDHPDHFELHIAGKAPLRLKPLAKPIPIENKVHPDCPDNLCFQVLPNGTTALLTIASFNYYWWSNLQEFKTFIDQSFQEIEAQGITDLIIDVRYNGGGSQHASIHLLKYLIRQPFQYFSSALYDEDEGIQEPFKNAYGGKLYFMIDGNGNSTTGHFMSLVKAHDLGVIIGEELGSNQFCTGGSTTCRLTNTQLEFYVATGTHITTATGLPDETGILPDHTIPQTIDAYLKRVDPVKDFTLGLIAE
jgi:hypothetical protein